MTLPLVHTGSRSNEKVVSSLERSICGALYRTISLDLFVTFHPSCVLLRNSAHGSTLWRIGAIAVLLAPSDGLPARQLCAPLQLGQPD